MEDRRFIVWDGHGVPLGTFADFDTAHEFAHMALTDAAVRLPLDVEDRRQRISRRVDHTRCELIVWQEFAALTGCPVRRPATE